MNTFSPELRERAVRLLLDNDGQHGSRCQAILSIAAKIGCSAHTLDEWVKKAEVDGGRRAIISTEMAEKLKALEREDRARRMRSCERPALILCWRSSTAGRSDGVVHRPASPRGPLAGWLLHPAGDAAAASRGPGIEPTVEEGGGATRHRQPGSERPREQALRPHRWSMRTDVDQRGDQREGQRGDQRGDHFTRQPPFGPGKPSGENRAGKHPNGGHRS